VLSGSLAIAASSGYSMVRTPRSLWEKIGRVDCTKRDCENENGARDLTELPSSGPATTWMRHSGSVVYSARR
jgi:hypothetical protein